VHRLSINTGADVTVAPNEISAGQARGWGAGRTMVTPLLVAPKFRPVSSRAEAARLRAGFGLPAREQLALVVSGSWGVGQVEPDHRRHRRVRPRAAGGRLRPQRRSARTAVRRRPSARLRVGREHARPDPVVRVVVQNAGDLSASEALACDVPVLTYRCLPGHGRRNAAVLDAEGTVSWIRSADEVGRRLATGRAPVPLPRAG
jgi:hypothetical protein